ncbi:MAG: aminotransferase class V-fold PLP-dependent enzyme, partial [Gaiellaceae bacterium]
LGCDADELVFGANVTSLNFTPTRTAGRDWQEGDEILVTDLDHDGNVAPWLELAADRGLVVRNVAVTDELQLDLDDLAAKLSERTRVVSFPFASNAVGSLVDASRVCALAREAGAISWVDAVHHAAHEPVDVRAIGADVLLCSPYKWCGPHLGMAAVRRELAETWRPYKARPSASTPLSRRFETGTLPYELLGGLLATFDYLDSIGGIDAIRVYERALGERFVAGLPQGVSLVGLQGMEGRVPTFLLNRDGEGANELAGRLAAAGMGVWAHDSWYCLGLADRLPPESVRVGFIHYNTEAEIDRLLEALA